MHDILKVHYIRPAGPWLCLDSNK